MIEPSTTDIMSSRFCLRILLDLMYAFALLFLITTLGVLVKDITLISFASCLLGKLIMFSVAVELISVALMLIAFMV